MILQNMQLKERDNLIRYLKERQIRLLDQRYFLTDKTKQENTVRYDVIDELTCLIASYEISKNK